ncbi:hypothetical protein HWI79_1964 [Cryptosporidium felis]|nr:hypothetical protein HWI79_1964 [Cryptosporidium felis]
MTLLKLSSILMLIFFTLVFSLSIYKYLTLREATLLGKKESIFFQIEPPKEFQENQTENGFQGSEGFSPGVHSRSIFEKFSKLPVYLKNFQENHSNFPELCREFWKKSVKASILPHRVSQNREIKPGPNFQVEEVLQFLNDTEYLGNKTILKIRISYKYYPKAKNKIQFLPSIYCIRDGRIKKPKKIKLRDVNHTLRYISKAIQSINKENLLRNHSQSHLLSPQNTETSGNLDLLLHYDDCPIIWNSMPFNIYRNDTLHIEKCVLNSKLSKDIQLLLSESARIFKTSQAVPLNPILDQIEAPVPEDSSPSTNPSSYLLSFSSEKEPTVISQIVRNNLPTQTACSLVNSFLNKAVSHLSSTNSNHIRCNGNVQCYLPCYFTDNSNSPSIFPSIYERLEKNDPAKVFKNLHCICKFNSKSSSGLILSISTHPNSRDLSAIPYANHLDIYEDSARSFLFSPVNGNCNFSNASSSFCPLTRPFDLKENSLFFIGRYTDTSRLDLSCHLFNLFSKQSPLTSFFQPNSTIKSQVFISDSNKISCKNRAEFLQNKTLCDSNFICRNHSVSFPDWVSGLSSSKFSLDLPGVGPWSNRLRILMLSDMVNVSPTRTSESENETKMILPRCELHCLFFTANYPQGSISRIVSNFAFNCLSEDGITQYFRTLLTELGTWELSSGSTGDFPVPAHSVLSSSPRKIDNPDPAELILISPVKDLKDLENRLESCFN